MGNKFEGALDRIGKRILQELVKNARSTFSEIGRKVGLSSPAVAERVYKMEEAGIICGYHARIDPDTIGRNVFAFVTLTTQSNKYPKIFEFASKTKEVLECHHISGEDSLIFKVGVGSISHLDKLVEKLNAYGETKTAIVLSSPVQERTIEII
ncbi:MAG: Lrp/AsnC family transcriptional regulator [Desulfobacteraceae bacterium]|nr:Lrp/AsnC family transcriptional regulator [Desulfobacteraceae bacterium]